MYICKHGETPCQKYRGETLGKNQSLYKFNSIQMINTFNFLEFLYLMSTMSLKSNNETKNQFFVVV